MFAQLDRIANKAKANREAAEAADARMEAAQSLIKTDLPKQFASFAARLTKVDIEGTAPNLKAIFTSGMEGVPTCEIVITLHERKEVVYARVTNAGGDDHSLDDLSTLAGSVRFAYAQRLRSES